MVRNEECRSAKEQISLDYGMTKRYLNDSTIDNVETMPNPIHWPTTGIQPTACQKGKSLFFIVVVHSAVNNFERRQRFRALWPESLKIELAFDIVFVTGSTRNVSVQDKLELEAHTYGDILQSNAVDDYKQLPIKAQAWLKYLNETCAHKETRFVLKIDDDVEINLSLYHRFLLDQRYESRSLFCLTYKHVADRKKDSKWYLSPSEFPFRNLGIFCAGLAYTLSMDLVPEMYENTKYTRFVWLDDWYVTHALLNRVDFTMYDIRDLYFVSEYKRQAFHLLRQVIVGNLPTPLFGHLKERSYFTEKRQFDLWKRSQSCVHVA
ncbi:Glycosyl transferase domain containing protein [Aphelenchoides besseyi]|nr:Glycosyl transferase domain containing protein [Aphelenchoides besseyi]